AEDGIRDFRVTGVQTCALPIYDLLIPDVARWELAEGGSHDYDLPEDTFARLEGMLVVMKMHVHGSPWNVELLRRFRVPYVVLHQIGRASGRERRERSGVPRAVR